LLAQRQLPVMREILSGRASSPLSTPQQPSRIVQRSMSASEVCACLRDGTGVQGIPSRRLLDVGSPTGWRPHRDDGPVFDLYLWHDARRQPGALVGGGVLQCGDQGKRML